ncbi:MAG: precorrin-4 C(11)-methyltransferase [Proteobacteria bacterium]|nr:precorrin-4 C(11)-methyltransferase [Pseudomonadota bacterium]
MNENRSPILFVGAGPGHPDLITVAGRRALEAADLIVFAGSLVSRDMLTWARPDAECVDSAGMDLEAIVERMTTGFENGLRVVRLHTGDPSLYGATREQFIALEKRGVPYRVIPGVTAAFAAAAALGLEFTLPEVCQTLILTRASGRTPVPEAEDLAGLAAHRASLAVYLSGGLTDEVASALVPAYGPDAPVAMVYRASWPDEQIIWTTASRLADDVARAGLTRQVLILAGRAVEVLQQGGHAPASKLYDAGFEHGFRSGREPADE